MLPNTSHRLHTFERLSPHSEWLPMLASILARIDSPVAQSSIELPSDECQRIRKAVERLRQAA